MGNYTITEETIYNYIYARTPLIIIDSPERERVERMLRCISEKMHGDIAYYTDASNVTMLKASGTMSVDEGPLAFANSYFRKHKGQTFAIGDIKRIHDDNLFSRELLNTLYVAQETGNTLILITADEVWSRIAQFGMRVTLDYPDMQERISLVERFISEYSGRYTIEWNESDISIAATLLRGFSEIQISNILSTELIGKNGLYRDNLYELTAQKSGLYSAVSSVQMIEVKRNMEVAGLEGLKSWLDDKKKLFFASEEMLNARDLQTPKGILLTGVPGCGKSYSAKMIAREWELPLFRFDIGSIYDKWVGSSEQRMKDALQFIDNVSPCVIWIDEIEKALSISDTGNDTGKRVLGQFLFWLQESQSRVFLVATANDISKLPFELFRKGRFSEVFFIDLPNRDERRAAIRQYADRSLQYELNEADMETLVNESQGFSYSDIEYAIKEVAQKALLEGQDVINTALIAETFRGIVPISRSNPEMIEAIRAWGYERAVAASC